jgi:hypothetical protein
LPPTAELEMPTIAPEDLAERTCARCQMKVRWVAAKGAKTPPNWIERGKDAYCLSCRRELAVETALEEMPEDAPASGRAKIRSRAVVEFEILRDPDRRDGEIARAARCSVMAVSKARKRLKAERAN